MEPVKNPFSLTSDEDVETIAQSGLDTVNEFWAFG